MRDKKPKSERPRHHTASEWRELIEQWKKSGQSPEQFAAAHGVTVKTLKWWDTTFRTGRDAKPSVKTPAKARTRKALAQAPRMVAVRIEPAPPSGARWELHTAHGHTLRGHDALGPEHLTALLHALLRAPRTP